MDKKYLTPEEVREFINFGVDFGDTICVHFVLGNTVNFELRNSIGGLAFRTSMLVKWEELPAPNLQEVLEVLPKQLIRNGEICRLCLIYNYNSQVWHAGYKCRVESWYGDFCPYNSNPLIVVANLLRWLCNNHPETLTKTE